MMGPLDFVSWDDLLAAAGLMLVFEGLMPFISPPRMREVWQKLAEQNDQNLRLLGMFSMLAGLATLYLGR